MPTNAPRAAAHGRAPLLFAPILFALVLAALVDPRLASLVLGGH